MRLANNRPIRQFVFTAIAAMLAMALALAFGTGVSFAKAETTEAHYYEDENANLCVGLPDGSLFLGSCQWQAVTGQFNVGVGDGALGEETNGDSNVAIGRDALASNTTGYDNTASSALALFYNTTGHDNTASGLAALFSNTTGKYNIASGFEALTSNTSGESNVGLGSGAGANLTTGSNNIDIANEGATGEGGTTRIGTEGSQTKAFVAGIYPEHLTGCPVQVTSEGQLGCNSAAAGPTGATGPSGHTGPTGPTGPAGPAGTSSIVMFGNENQRADAGHNCLTYANTGRGDRCISTGFAMDENSLEFGPVPTGGSTISHLAATTNGSATKQVITVLDNGAATALTCTNTVGSTCNDDIASVAIPAGDFIEVRVSGGTARAWKVTFLQ